MALACWFITYVFQKAFDVELRRVGAYGCGGYFAHRAAIVRLVKVKGNEKIKLIGKSALGTFISYGTQKTSGKVAVYYIEYSFEDEGKKYVCKTPHEFNWYEVLTLKVVGDFPIKVYNGKSVLDCDIMKMHLDNREAVAELNAKYEQAIDELSQDK